MMFFVLSEAFLLRKRAKRPRTSGQKITKMETSSFLFIFVPEKKKRMRGRQAGYTVSARTDHPAKRLFLYEAIIMGVTTGTAEEFCVSIENV